MDGSRLRRLGAQVKRGARPPGISAGFLSRAFGGQAGAEMFVEDNQP
jgi:hypothetical protein